ncbi:MAG: hypothetical protein KAT09_08800 [Candidatus Aegiribacteria sp.]|nr:hypothetical protein [Candidatus Aegiribacteria sp.]
MKQMSLIQRTQQYFNLKYKVELSEDQVRVAMKRLSMYFRWLAKWYSGDEKEAASAALHHKEGEHKNVS